MIGRMLDTAAGVQSRAGFGACGGAVLVEEVAGRQFERGNQLSEWIFLPFRLPRLDQQQVPDVFRRQLLQVASGPVTAGSLAKQDDQAGLQGAGMSQRRIDSSVDAFDQLGAFVGVGAGVRFRLHCFTRRLVRGCCGFFRQVARFVGCGLRIVVSGGRLGWSVLFRGRLPFWPRCGGWQKSRRVRQADAQGMPTVIGQAAAQRAYAARPIRAFACARQKNHQPLGHGDVRRPPECHEGFARSLQPEDFRRRQLTRKLGCHAFAARRQGGALCGYRGSFGCGLHFARAEIGARYRKDTKTDPQAVVAKHRFLLLGRQPQD